ncbi:trypsin-like serine protease [Ramicandelaber brevisporus]|nr:trypsin-like serine protease [Ramicandelaber brevisporus]
MRIGSLRLSASSVTSAVASIGLGLNALVALSSTFSSGTAHLANAMSKTDMEAALINPRITGGVKVSNIAEYPFMLSLRVRMRYTDGTSEVTQCSGAILTQDYFLTTASCMYNYNMSSFSNVSDTTVYYGSTAFSGSGKSTTVTKGMFIGITDFPDLVGYTNDLVIGQVGQPFEFGSDVQPIKVASSQVPDNMTATILGWGSTAIALSTATALNYGTVSIAPDSQCKAASTNKPGSYSDRNTGRLVCTGNTPGVALCKGDVGNPLVYKENGKYVLLGLASFRDWNDARTRTECGDSNTWDYYTRAAFWADAISQRTKLNKDDFMAPAIDNGNGNKGGSSGSSNSGLSTGAIIGIAVGGGVALIVIIFLLYWFCIKKKPAQPTLIGEKEAHQYDPAAPQVVYQPVLYVEQPVAGVYDPATGLVSNAYTTGPVVVPAENYYDGAYGTVSSAGAIDISGTSGAYHNPYATYAGPSVTVDTSAPPYSYAVATSESPYGNNGIPVSSTTTATTAPPPIPPPPKA